MPPISLKLVLELASAALLMALGAFLAVWLYANPRIHGLQVQIAQIQAEDAKATASFLAAAQAKEKELQDAKDAAEAQFAAAQAENEKRAAALLARNGSLQRIIASYSANHDGTVPRASDAACPVDDRPAVLGPLLSECLSVASESASGADALADQVRGLQRFLSGASP
jgi:hypothetical protein